MLFRSYIINQSTSVAIAICRYIIIDIPVFMQHLYIRTYIFILFAGYSISFILFNRIYLYSRIGIQPLSHPYVRVMVIFSNMLYIYSFLYKIYQNIVFLVVFSITPKSRGTFPSAIQISSGLSLILSLILYLQIISLANNNTSHIDYLFEVYRFYQIYGLY